MRLSFHSLCNVLTKRTVILLIMTVSLLFPAITTAAQNASTAPNSLLPFSVSGQGYPLILIHAFPADRRLWAPQADGLKTSFQVITPDLKGFGVEKTSSGDAVTMREHARQIKEIMDQMHIEKAILGGESMGGYVVLSFLSQYPDRVAGIILSNTRATADSAETKAQREAAAQEVLTQGTEAFVKGFMAKALSQEANSETRSSVYKMFSEQTAAGIASGLRGMALRDDTTRVLSETTVPVLIITSDLDKVIPPSESKEMHAQAKNSRLVILAHAGHLSNLEQPKAWNQAVLDFYSEQNIYKKGSPNNS